MSEIIIDIDRDWINGPFKNIMTTFNWLIKYNNRSIPILGPFTEQIFKSLRNISIYFQNKYNILTYDPFYSDPDIYFCNNPLYVNNDRITFANLLQYTYVLNQLQDVTNYLIQRNFETPDVDNIISLSARINYVLNYFIRYIPQVNMDIEKAGVRIGYKNMQIFAVC